MRFESCLLLMFIWRYSAGFWYPKIYNGELNPSDPKVCTSQNITFTCKLLDPPVLNRTIGFSIKTRSTGINYIPVEEAEVTVLNETVSQMTIYNISMETKTSTVRAYVKCSYWQDFGDQDPELELGDVSSAMIYPKPEPVQGFNCIVFNYKWMNCSWDFGTDYGIHPPNITFLWRVPSYSASWNPCPSNNSTKEGHCIWNGTRDGYFKNLNITVRLILQQPCGLNVTSDFDIDTSRIVKPNPVVGLTATPVNSTCISVKWVTSDSEIMYPKEHKVTLYQTQGNKTKEVERFNTTRETENLPHNRTICKLRPFTEYEFSVSIRPIGVYSGYFSEERKTKATTLSAKPSASPEVTDGGYSWQTQDCQENARRLVCTFWKPIKDEDKNGHMTGLVGLFNPKSASFHPTREDWAQDVTYGCTRLMCNTSYTFHILARNEKGESERASEIEIPPATLGLRQPRFVVESVNNSSVYVTWTHSSTSATHGFTVAWCRNKDGDCENKSKVDWKRVPLNTNDVVIPIDPSNAAQDFLYGVSALSDQGSSGFEWQDCVYLKHAKPSREPQNVIVTNGPDDNMLIVTWDKLMCKSDQPYIDMYNIQYRNRKDGNRKSVDVTALAEARLVLEDLKEDVTYEITVRAVTKDGQYGPESQQQIGTPINRSLKPGSIVGITMAVLVCVIFAGVGCFCAIRRCKNKAKRAIHEAGNITIPTVTGLDLGPTIQRQESYDSGYDMSPTSDKSCDLLEFRSSAFVSPDDYHYPTEWKGDIQGTSSENPNSIKELKIPSTALQNYSNKLKSIHEIPRPLAFIQGSASEMSSKEIKNTDSDNEKSVDYVTVRKVYPYNSDSSRNPLDAPSSSMKSCDTEIKIEMQNNGNQPDATHIIQSTEGQTQNAVDMLSEMHNQQDVDDIRSSELKTQSSLTDHMSRHSTTSVNNEAPPEIPSNDNRDYVAPSQAFTEHLFTSPKSLDIPESMKTRNDLNACSTESKDLVSLSSGKSNGKVSNRFDGYVISDVNPSSRVPSTQMTSDITRTANTVEQKSSEGRTLKFSHKYSENSDFCPQSGNAETNPSKLSSDKNETCLIQASCTHDNSGFEPGTDLQSGVINTGSSHSFLAPYSQHNSDYVPCSCLQSGVPKPSSSDSGLAPCDHDNSAYVSNDTVKNRVPLSASEGYVPHWSVENLPHQVDEYDSKGTVSTVNNFEINFAVASLETDDRLHNCNEDQSNDDKADGNIQSINTYQLNSYSPKHFIYPTPDAYVLPSQEYMQSTDKKEVEEGTFNGYVDETFAKVPLKEERNVRNKPISTESQNDGYVDHAALDIFHGQRHVDIDKERQC